MATAQTPSDVPKPSFAKVAASASKNKIPITAVHRVATTAKDGVGRTAAADTPPPVVANGQVGKARARAAVSSQANQNSQPSTATPDSVDKITDGVKALAIVARTPSLAVNGNDLIFPDKPKPANRDSASDDSQKADSTSDLGTKPPSLDGKSTTSATTFALDEKESLRPDDSASVKAATAEDDDAFSVRGSLLASSRMGSEIALRARAAPPGDIAERRPPQQLAGPNSQGMTTLHGAASDQQPIAGTAMPLANATGSADALHVIYRQHPDEKLLEAMQSSKDRIFLLRLEKKVIEFVQDSKEPYMDLPPGNSFCRMLTHKLADYYHMTHSYEHHIGAVRIFRTPFCRVPPSLASIATNASNSSTPPPQVQPKKIMRRGEDGDAALSSTSPSKATSEVGSDQKDKASSSKEKMTREEREEAYNRARERIFGNESTPENDVENGVSRASSVSTKDKSNVGKRAKPTKQRRDSGSFESRTQYAPYWGSQQPTWVPQQPQYIPINNSAFNGQMQQQYAPQAQPVFPPPPPQNYPPMMPNPGYQPFPNMAQYPPPPPQQSQQRFPPPAGGMAPYVAPPMPSAPQQQAWQPSFNPAPYAHPVPRAVPSGPSPAGIPYAYGQLPVNANPHDPKSQHPIPGSYNRHAFNPKTQSFVPNSSVAQMPVHAPPYPPTSSHHGSPQIASPHLAYAGTSGGGGGGYQPGIPPPAPIPTGPGYGAARQGSNNTVPPFLPPPPQTHQHPPPVPQQLAQNAPQLPPKPGIRKGPPIGTQTYNHLPHYGNPATLPQKPT